MEVRRGTLVQTPSNDMLVWDGQQWLPHGDPAAIAALRDSAQLDPNKLESLGAGMADVYYGARQLTGTLSPEREAEVLDDRRVFDRNASTSDQIMRVGGQAAMAAPAGVIPGVGAAAGLTGAGARALGGAAAGALTGGVLLAEDGAERARNLTAGTVGGAVGGVVMPKVFEGAGALTRSARRSFRRAWGSASPTVRRTIDAQIDDAAYIAGAGNLDAGVRDGLRRASMRAFANGEEVTPAMLARRLRAEAAGFTDEAAMTRGQMSRNPVEYGTEHNLAKLPGGEALETRRAAQVDRMRALAEDVKTAPGRVDSFDAGELSERAVKRVARRMQDHVRRAYETAQASYGDGAQLSVEAFQARMGSVLRDFEDAVPAAVRNRIGQLASGQRDFTPLELEKLDKLISGAISPTAEPNQFMAARLLQRELVRVWGDSGYAQAKKLASERFRKLGRRTSTANRLLHDKMEPDQVVDTLMRGRVRDIRSLSSLIGDEPEWDQIGDAVLQKVISKSFANSADALSSGRFSPAAFTRQIDDMGTHRLRAIFGPERARKLQNLARVADDLFAFPQGHTANLSNSTIVAGQALAGTEQGRAVLTAINSVLASKTGGLVRLAAGERRAPRSSVKRAIDPDRPAPGSASGRVQSIGRRAAPLAGAGATAEGAREYAP